MLVLLALMAQSTRAEEAGGLRVYESKYYVVHTDLPEAEAREAVVRVDRVAEEYLGRTAGFGGGGVKGRLPFYLYGEVADYLKAGGIEGSGGVFDVERKRLMAVTLRRPDGVISLSTWHIVQHEGFHQFVHATVGLDVVPMWADEGLAEYFGQGLFTGDGFEAGLVPQARLVRVRAMMREKTYRPLKDFVAMTRAEWNERIEMRNYDQAWSLVHFLAHAEEGRWRGAFEAYMKEVGGGGDARKAYAKNLGGIADLEEKWRAWWLGLPDHPTSDLYDRATVEILTSFLGRAWAAGERFDSFEAFVRTRPDELKQPAGQWLPPTLFGMGVAEAQKMRGMGGTWALVKSAAGPVIMLRAGDGGRMVGRFEVSEKGVTGVRVEELAKGTGKRGAASQPGGEMIR